MQIHSESGYFCSCVMRSVQNYLQITVLLFQLNISIKLFVTNLPAVANIFSNFSKFFHKNWDIFKLHSTTTVYKTIICINYTIMADINTVQSLHQYMVHRLKDWKKFKDFHRPFLSTFKDFAKTFNREKARITTSNS